ncbi:MAG: F0F1 ATP synthase subunit A [Candidatus Jidaibacter sp.]|jgi:F-type H+-transporting ATPase subunit a|nr:F0F1 ATP synthase subunit A [Candidatus Jidaibacter sp.]
MHNPMEQFEVTRVFPIELFGYDISFTNASMMMAINLCAIFLLLFLTARKVSVIPGRTQMLGECIYGLIDDMILGTAGRDAKRYMPFIFSLFIFILTCNLLGMFPFSFTVTSHIIVTFAMAIVVFIGVTIIGFARHGFHYLSLFLPSGTPLAMAPLMIFTELFAYMVRPVSLSVRLAANMTAGHIVMKVIASFVIMAGIVGVLPFALLFALTGFELFVAVLQAYIFTILSCVYLTDAIKLH